MSRAQDRRGADPSAGSPSAGRPRSKRAHEAVLGATRALLETMTYDQVSVDRIATESGVSKRTIYRWWPNKAAIVMEVAASTDVEEPDTGTVRDDLLALLTGIFEVVATHRAAASIRGLLCEAQFDADFAEEFRAYIGRRRQLCRRILERGVARGELRADADLEVAADLLYGAYWNRFLIGHAPLSAAFAEAMVDTLLAGVGA